MRLFGSSLVACALALGLAACTNCPYESKCDGNTLKTCGVGVDQVVGGPDVIETPCEDPNPVCITVDPSTALCGIDLARTCALGAPPRCEGERLVTCRDGFEVAEDCLAEDNVCGLADEEARCFEAPLTACDPTWAPRCDGAQRRWCLNGYRRRQDCGGQGEGFTCVTSTTDLGTTGSCGPQ